MLDRSMLKELEVTSMQGALCILKQDKETTLQTTYTKVPAAKLLQLNLEMIHQPEFHQLEFISVLRLQYQRSLLSYLLDFAKNRIILNKDKFQFCQDVVTSGGSRKCRLE